MYHKSVLKNQIWWLILPLSFVFISLLGLFAYLFFFFQKGFYEEDLSLHRDIFLERMRDDYKNKEILAILLSKALLDIDQKSKASIEELEEILNSYWKIIEEVSLLSSDISFGFVLSEQGEMFLAQREGKEFLWLDDLSLSSLVSPSAIMSETNDVSKSFYLSPVFQYTKEDGRQEEHVFLAKALFEDQTGRFLGSYGIVISLSDWVENLSSLLKDIRAVIILNKDRHLLASNLALEEEIRIQPNLLENLISPFASWQEEEGDLILNESPFWRDYHFNFSFFPLEVKFLRDPLYILLGFPAFTYENFSKEIVLPFVLFSVIASFLSFILAYSFMEIFIWKPLNILTRHIVDISSRGDLFVDLPEGVLVEEINYLFIQFKFFQKRIASLLFEMKNLYQQSSSSQDIIFQKSSQIYFDSKEVIDHSGKLDSDNEFLNQFLDKFAGRYKDIFNLSEDIVSLLGKTIRWKSNMLSAWSHLFKIVESLDSATGREELNLNIKRLSEWVKENGDSLKIITKELSAIQKLLLEFSQSRLDLTNSFFDIRESLNFLMDTTRETTGFLNRLKGEVEELFLVQSQDLQKTRDRMKQLLKNI